MPARGKRVLYMYSAYFPVSLIRSATLLPLFITFFTILSSYLFCPRFSDRLPFPALRTFFALSSLCATRSTSVRSLLTLISPADFVTLKPLVRPTLHVSSGQRSHFTDAVKACPSHPDSCLAEFGRSFVRLRAPFSHSRRCCTASSGGQLGIAELVSGARHAGTNVRRLV